jgi:transcriptional regulator with XRE-family HTH domain
MAESEGRSEQQRRIIREEIADPLEALRTAAGGPSKQKIEERTRLSRNTVGNAFGDRHLVRLDTLEMIVTALGGDLDEWKRRRAAAVSRLKALDQPDVSAPRRLANRLPLPLPLRPRSRHRPLSRPAAIVAGAAVLGLAGWGIAGLANRENGTSAAPQGRRAASPASGSPSAAGREQVLYYQCSKPPLDRSILSRPGHARGGKSRGQLRPGERFVVSSGTHAWRYGYVERDPDRNGWVLAEYLCRM